MLPRTIIWVPSERVRVGGIEGRRRLSYAKEVERKGDIAKGIDSI
jgi:hypothetical protein